MTEYERCVNVVLQKEGWGTYTNNPQDPGGPTKYGITLRLLSAYRQDPSLTARDVQALQEAEALEIYRQEMWNPINGDNLPPGINLMTFDCAVNQGLGQATRWLQAAAGITPVDGLIGPASLAKISSSDPETLLDNFKQERLQSYEQDRGWRNFGHGWENRDDQIAALALTWATAS